MVVHSAAQLVEYVSVQTLIGSTVVAAGAWSVKAWAGGRKCTWEREWAGKMIMVVGPPTTTVLSLISTLLRLPSPPQILYLPPLPSPLPQDLLTILHTLRLSTSNPQAQLHCEPLPPTPRGVRDFVRKWASSPQGTVGEGGRRVDAVILAEGWEVLSPKQWGKMRFEGSGASEADGSRASVNDDQKGEGEGTSTMSNETDQSKSNMPSQPQPSSRPAASNPTTTSASAADPPWTTHQYHLHLLTSLLPHFLRTPERDIRLITLISPGYAAALPSLQTLNPTLSNSSPLIRSGIKGLTSLLLMARFGLILDTLASAMPVYKPVPAVDDDVNAVNIEKEKEIEGKKEVNRKSNVMALSVVMPWCRGDVIRGIWGADETWLRWILYMIFFPLLLILTPSPTKSTQSIIYALSAPIRIGPMKKPTPLQPIQPGQENKRPKEGVEVEVESDPRRSGIAGGDVVRDCAIIDLPPVLCDPLVAKAHYDKLEKEVEEGVRQSQIRERAFGASQPKNTPK